MKQFIFIPLRVRRVGYRLDQFIQSYCDQKQDADVPIHREERGIHFGEVIGTDETMFIIQESRNHCGSYQADPAQFLDP